MVASATTLRIITTLLEAALESGASAEREEGVGIWFGEGAGWGSSGEGEKGRDEGEDDGGTHLD